MPKYIGQGLNKERCSGCHFENICPVPVETEERNKRLIMNGTLSDVILVIDPGVFGVEVNYKLPKKQFSTGDIQKRIESILDTYRSPSVIKSTIENMKCMKNRPSNVRKLKYLP